MVMNLGLGLGLTTVGHTGEEPTPAAPSNSSLPAISGTSQAGETLACTSGGWSGYPTPTYAYQWKIDGANVGTNQNTYVPQPADEAGVPSCVVTATNSEGSASATSVNYTAVAAASGGSVFDPAVFDPTVFA